MLFGCYFFFSLIFFQPPFLPSRLSLYSEIPADEGTLCRSLFSNPPFPSRSTEGCCGPNRRRSRSPAAAGPRRGAVPRAPGAPRLSRFQRAHWRGWGGRTGDGSHSGRWVQPPPLGRGARSGGAPGGAGAVGDSSPRWLRASTRGEGRGGRAASLPGRCPRRRGRPHAPAPPLAPHVGTADTPSSRSSRPTSPDYSSQRAPRRRTTTPGRLRAGLSRPPPPSGAAGRPFPPAPLPPAVAHARRRRGAGGACASAALQ